MNKYKFFFSLILAFSSTIAVTAQSRLSDRFATPQTVSLYQTLQTLPGNKVLFGHQDDVSAGVSWRNVRNRSDIKELTGDYSAVCGFDLGGLELDKDTNISKINFNLIRDYTKESYQRGGIVTFSWHCVNPVNPTLWVKSQRVTNTIQQMFAQPDVLARYNTWLDKLADYFLSLKDDDGTLIPVLFRPFHENTGSWFWWGKKNCTPDEYVKLWKYTVDYLNKTKHVHNLIYVYCVDRFKGSDDFLERYPGDNYADVLSFDIYEHENPNGPINGDAGKNFLKQASAMVSKLRDIAQSKHKPYAIAEIGYKVVPEQNWWTETLLPMVQNSGLSYVLLWGNYNPTYYFAPYKGQAGANDFMKFYSQGTMMFQGQLKQLSPYSKRQ